MLNPLSLLEFSSSCSSLPLFKPLFSKQHLFQDTSSIFLSFTLSGHPPLFLLTPRMASIIFHTPVQTPSLANTTSYPKLVPSPGKSHIKSHDSLVELTTITDADGLSPETDLAETVKTSRKVIYDWSLLDGRDGLPRTPSKEEFNQLFKLFPKTMSVAVIGPMLRIVVQDLPAKPWPFNSCRPPSLSHQ